MTGLAFVKPSPFSSAPAATELFKLRGARTTLVGTSDVAEALEVLGGSESGLDCAAFECVSGCPVGGGG